MSEFTAKCSEGNGTIGKILYDEGELIISVRPDRLPCTEQVCVIGKKQTDEILKKLAAQWINHSE